jgi:antitoxin component of RelBE/YafQ-DinJ toxin-antitoxin module
MGETPMRFVRIDDETWHRAQARARREGVTMSAMIRSWVSTYAEEPVPVEHDLKRVVERINAIRHRLRGE